MGISFILGVMLVLSGFGVLAVVKFANATLVNEKQKVLLNSVAWLDVGGGVLVMALALAKILP